MTAAKKIDASHPFMDRNVIMNLANGVTNTLKTMADVVAQFEKPFVSEGWKPTTELSVSLDLSLAPFKGQIRFHFDKQVAKTIIEKMTSSEILDENSNELLDGVGEISNMFYGTAKTKLNEIGFKLSMSTPHPCWTKDLPVVASSKATMIVPFKIIAKHCYVEIVIF